MLTGPVVAFAILFVYSNIHNSLHLILNLMSLIINTSRFACLRFAAYERYSSGAAFLAF